MMHFKTFLKTFFIALLVFVVLELWFWWYMKFFNQDLASKVAWYIYKTQKTTQIEPTENLENKQMLDQIQLLLEKISNLENQISNMSNDIQNINETENKPDNKIEIPVSNWKTTVKLYYFNQEEDKKLSVEQQLNVNSILPIERTISKSDNLIEDVIALLLEWKLTNEEIEKWFHTSFPNEKFYLKNFNLDSDWTLTLEFSQVAWFTSWGSAQQLLLKASIEKTVRQFSEVKQVKFLPDTLFQP